MRIHFISCTHFSIVGTIYFFFCRIHIITMNNMFKPECGGPNPLVRTANQISGSSTISTLANMSRAAGQRKTMNAEGLVNEFNKVFTTQQTFQPTISKQTNIQANVQANIQANMQANTQSNTQTNSQTGRRAGMMTEMNSMNLAHHYHRMAMPTPDLYAKDQLEIKYRQDLLEQTKQENDDDIQFWQSLAQKYNQDDHLSQMLDEKLWFQLGSTDKPVYPLDEANPFLDKFEDPFAEGLKKMEIGDIPSAVLLFEAAVIKDKQHADAWRWLGTSQAQNENDKLAIKALFACLELNPNDGIARFALAVSSANESKHLQACDHLITYLSQNEKYSKLVDIDKYELSKLNSNTFSPDHISEPAYNYVRDAFIQAARQSPNNLDSEVQSALGVIFNIRGEYEKAADCFKAALSVNQDDSLLWNRLGATLANGNKSEAAVSAYRQALKLSPGFCRSRFNLAISCVNLGAYREAAEQLVTILNTQAAGRGVGGSSVSGASKGVASTNIWNTLRTVVTLMNRPDLYPQVDGRDLASLSKQFLQSSQQSETA